MQRSTEKLVRCQRFIEVFTDFVQAVVAGTPGVSDAVQARRDALEEAA